MSNISRSKLWITKLLILAIVVTLCGLPETLQAQTAQQPTTAEPTTEQAQQPQADPQPQGQAEPAPAGTQNPGIVDPSKGPLAPVPSNTDELPNAPSSSSNTAQQGTQEQQQQKSQQPLGAAAAQTGPTAGGAASKPAGNAIAPAKQRQVRSLLIKLGAVAAAGIAIGTVVALSKGSSSKPPGAQ